MTEYTSLPSEEYEWKFDDPSPAILRCCLDDDLNLHFDDEIPNWLDFEMSEVGIECVMDIHDWVTWALQNGLCSQQGFTIRMWRPEYHQDYWGECDVDYTWEMLGIEEVDPAESLRFWQSWMERS
jgi:hypothetical protein